jgi:hypothetical protein
MGFITTPVSYFRLNAIPLDTTEVYSTYEQLTSYAATSDKVYFGQVCTVVDDGAYLINTDRTVTKLGTGGGSETTKEYRTDYVGNSALYIGTAQINSLENSPVWTIKKSIFSPVGVFISSTTSLNIAWTNRYIV